PVGLRSGQGRLALVTKTRATAAANLHPTGARTRRVGHCQVRLAWIDLTTCRAVVSVTLLVRRARAGLALPRKGGDPWPRVAPCLQPRSRCRRSAYWSRAANRSRRRSTTTRRHLRRPRSPRSPNTP